MIKLFKKKYLLISGDLTKELGGFGQRVVYKNRNYMAVKWCLQAYLICKQMGLKNLPSPLSAYDFTKSPYRPYKHQSLTSDFLATNFKCFCWNEAGTGKTASCIWAYDFLKQEKILNKLLVICPLSTTQNVWGNELFKMLPMCNNAVLIGTRQKRLNLLAKNYDIYIINHDGIKILTEELSAWKPDLIIVDEHTAFKNLRTERFKCLVNLVKKTKALWMLSGTPAPQAPTDVFAPARLVCPDLVGRSFVRFRDRLMQQVSMYRWIPRGNFEQILKECVQPVIRYTRDECLDLPDVTTLTYEVAMSPAQKDTFNKLRRDAMIQIADGLITASNEGVMRNKLLQCCSGYVYGEDKVAIPLNPKHRLEALKEIIDECARGVLVFMNFRSSVLAVYKYLFKTYTIGVITGATSVKKRNRYFKEFQEGKIKVLIAHPRTMGHGITLTKADTIVWYLVTSDNELYEQANSRIQRIGQGHKMRVIHLVSTTLEKTILTRLEEKRSMQGLLLDVLSKK